MQTIFLWSFKNILQFHAEFQKEQNLVVWWQKNHNFIFRFSVVINLIRTWWYSKIFSYPLTFQPFNNQPSWKNCWEKKASDNIFLRKSWRKSSNCQATIVTISSSIEKCFFQMLSVQETTAYYQKKKKFIALRFPPSV